MGKAQDLLEKLGGKVTEGDKDDKDDLVPINEPEDAEGDKGDKADDFSDINVEGDDVPKPDMKAEIINFFRENPNPPDSKVHELADELGIEHSDLESMIYGILTTYLSIGKHQGSKDEDFDPEQLKMGMEVEKEHTDDPLVAKEIAKDHLVEIPDYYTRLKAMEDEGKKAKEDKPEEKPEEKPAEDENDV